MSKFKFLQLTVAAHCPQSPPHLTVIIISQHARIDRGRQLPIPRSYRSCFLITAVFTAIFTGSCWLCSAAWRRGETASVVWRWRLHSEHFYIWTKSLIRRTGDLSCLSSVESTHNTSYRSIQDYSASHNNSKPVRTWPPT